MRGVVLDDGTDDHRWRGGVRLQPARHLPEVAARSPCPRLPRLVERWRSIPHDDGYESKIDAVLTKVPHLRAAAEGGLPDDLACTYAIAPTVADMHRGYEMIGRGEVLDKPGLLANTPTVADPGLDAAGRHVLSLEALFTPYGLPGGWANSSEPSPCPAGSTCSAHSQSPASATPSSTGGR